MRSVEDIYRGSGQEGGTAKVQLQQVARYYTGKVRWPGTAGAGGQVQVQERPDEAGQGPRARGARQGPSCRGCPDCRPRPPAGPPGGGRGEWDGGRWEWRKKEGSKDKKREQLRKPKEEKEIEKK